MFQGPKGLQGSPGAEGLQGTQVSMLPFVLFIVCFDLSTFFLIRGGIRWDYDLMFVIERIPYTRGRGRRYLSNFFLGISTLLRNNVNSQVSTTDELTEFYWACVLWQMKSTGLQDWTMEYRMKREDCFKDFSLNFLCDHRKQSNKNSNQIKWLRCSVERLVNLYSLASFKQEF